MLRVVQGPLLLSHGAPDAQQIGLRTGDSDLREALSHLIGPPFLMETGAWLPSASLLVGSEPGVLLNTPRVFLLVGNLMANSGQLSIPSTSMVAATSQRPSIPCVASSLLGPTSMPRVILPLRGALSSIRGHHPSPASSPPPRGLPGPWGWGLAHG